MGIVTRILVSNLSEATSVRLNGATEAYMDTPEGFRIPMSKDVEKLSNTNKIKVEGALRTSVDQTEVNNAILVDFFTPLTVDNRRKWLDVLVTVDEVPAAFTRMYVVAKNDNAGQWEVEFALPEDHWVELATQKKINTIDFGPYTLTKANVETSWDSPTYDGDYTPMIDDGPGWNDAYAFWPVDYGDWVDRRIPDQNTLDPVKMLAVEDLRPFVNYMYLLKRGFCEIGWTLGGRILETEYWRSTWAYLLKQEYYLGTAYDGLQYGKFGRIIGRTITADTVFGATLSDRYIYFTALEYVGSSGAELPFNGDPSKWMCGIQNPLPFKSKFKLSFKFQLEAHPIVVVDQSFIFNMQEIDPDDAQNETFTGQILSDPQDVSFIIEPSQTKFIAFDFTIELEPGQKAALSWLGNIGSFAGIIKKGMWFRCEPANDALTRNDVIDARTVLRDDISLMDELKSFVHFINGRVETDYTQRTVNVYPEKTTDVWGEVVAGFVRDDLPAEDISADIIASSVKTTFIRPDLKRYTRLSFANSSDDYIDSLVLTEPLHSRRILNGEDLPDEIDEIQNPIYEPTAEGQTTLLKRQLAITAASGTRLIASPYLPRMWDNSDGNRSFDIGPRLLVAFGEVRQINKNYLDDADKYVKIYWDSYSIPVTIFGYATTLRTWDLHQSGVTDPPEKDYNLIFGRAKNDLFVTNYIGLTNDNRGGAIIDLLQLVSMAQYNRYNFRALFSFPYEGRTIRIPMTAIRDFSPDIPTPVTYFASPVDTGCCDLPCSCRFTECDYYQDFGQYLRQDTLDDLNISSFKVDNVEQLSGPVSLGQLNMIDISGGVYVTNLVDTLNAIEVPYFFFDYSTRVHDAKGLRFFKIKRPACQTFEIIISDVGDEVYRYTESAQQEQWFAGSWGAIGYAPETFTAPDNCVTTVEY